VPKAWHLAGEAVWRVASQWEIRADAYSRWQPVLPQIDYGAMFGDAAGGPTDGGALIQARRGAAVGAGVRLVHDQRWRDATWRHELAYDAGWATRRFPSRFGESLQPPPWLEPHRLLLASEATLPHGVRLGGRVRSILHRPWALRQAYYDLFGAAPDVSGLPIMMPGAMRRPALVDADVGAAYTRRVGGLSTEVAVNLTNATNRSNVLDYGLRRQPDGEGFDMVPRFLAGRQLALTVQLTR